MNMSEILSQEQLLREAQAAYRRGDYEAAVQSFNAARESYLAIGDELNAAEMANNASVALLQNGKAEEALQSVIGTAAIFAAAGDHKRQAIALGNQAAALEEMKRLDEAEQLYWQSAEILKNINETDLRLSVMQSISALQLRSGRQLQAVATMQSGIDGIEKPTFKQRALKRLLEIPIKMIGDGP
ncbi:MAG TPA: tetratricopeptide repeat protein [Anaerolineales bacterium]|nr:tetratricopeptide repeat protein [Anaerolineales bacterium]